MEIILMLLIVVICVLFYIFIYKDSKDESVSFVETMILWMLLMAVWLIVSASCSKFNTIKSSEFYFSTEKDISCETVIHKEYNEMFSEGNMVYEKITTTSDELKFPNNILLNGESVKTILHVLVEDK